MSAIGDATEWDPDAGGPRIVEIKTNPRQTDPKQKERMAAAHAALYEGATLPGGHRDERLHDLGLPLRTHLDLLRTATERAAAEGICALKVPGGRALLAIDLYG